jgi:hypothetical protein
VIECPIIVGKMQEWWHSARLLAKPGHGCSRLDERGGKQVTFGAFRAETKVNIVMKFQSIRAFLGRHQPVPFL